MLLYLVKYSRPDIANAVRELSKGMKEATEDRRNIIRLLELQNPVQQRLNEDMDDRATTYDQED
jgi:hypothetical protein